MTEELRAPSRATRAINDVLEGIARWEMWGTLGWHDIKQRYRRSMLGPFWLTLSTGVMVGALGLVYATIFRMPLDRYLPFLAVGLVVWTLLSAIVTDGCQVFIAAEQVIKQIRLPFTAHACRVLWRNLIIFAHNLVIVAVVMVWYRNAPDIWSWLLLVPAILLFLLNGLWIILLLGLISARFRDVPLLVGSLLQIAFFLTPILWHPDSMPGRNRIVYWNPLYHFVELLRAPFLGSTAELRSWVIVAVITVLGWLLTFSFFIRFRARIALWV